jgi:hypothetical protein
MSRFGSGVSDTAFWCNSLESSFLLIIPNLFDHIYALDTKNDEFRHSNLVDPQSVRSVYFIVSRLNTGLLHAKF